MLHLTGELNFTASSITAVNCEHGREQIGFWLLVLRTI